MKKGFFLSSFALCLHAKGASRRMVLLFLCILLGFSICVGTAGTAFGEEGVIYEGSCGQENTSGKKVLLAYDTKHGSTSEVAEKMAGELCASGLQVDTQLAWNVEDVASYDAVVLGSPIYWATFLPGALNFMDRYRSTLASKTVAVFVLSTNTDKTTGLVDENSLEFFVEPVLDQFPEIKPVGSIGLIPGRILFNEVLPMEFVNLKLSGYDVVGDLRNYDVESAWTQEIAALLK